MKFAKFYSTAIILLAVVFFAQAQNGVTSPYSQFGYGLLRDNATSAQQAMGGIGYGMHSGRQINVMNPASYARIDSLTFLFDMGMDMTCLWSKEVPTGLSESNIGGGLNYITMQFPLGKRLGMSIGILPYSSVGYAFGNTIDNGYSSRSGSGSINELYVGIAGRIIKPLSIGVNISYLFGSTTNDVYAITSDGSTSLYSKDLTVHDFHIDAGLLCTLPIGRMQWLTLGLTYTPGKNLLGKLTDSAIYANSSITETSEKISTRRYFSLASSYGVGVNYQRGTMLMVEGDFTYQPWANAKYMQFDDNNKPISVTGQFANRWKIAVGAQYQPSFRGSYARRIQYRLGAYYTRDYMVVTDNKTGTRNNVREAGCSVGVGLPIPGFKSVLNLGLGWTHRQAYPTSLIRENYLNITLGINFNEAWFRKSKIY